MIIYLQGGSASGKSRWGEALAASLREDAPGPLVYLATMSPGEDPETRARIARHRAARAGKGFATLERPLNLAELPLPSGATVLLEDLGNLTANEFYAPRGGGEPALLRGLESLFSRAEHLVIIGNSVFEEDPGLTWKMAAYLGALSAAQTLCAARADAAAEVICGIPLWHKSSPAVERRLSRL